MLDNRDVRMIFIWHKELKKMGERSFLQTH